MLQRGLLRISKRMKKNGSLSSIDTRSEAAESFQDEWSKYDDRLLDCIHQSDLPKLKETLKKKGVSPVKLSRDGQTAMHIAVKKNMVEYVDCMIAEQPDLSTTDSQGRTVYHVAAANGDTILLKKALDYSRWNLDIKDSNDMIPLHHAVQSNEKACVKLLIDNNSPLDFKDNESRTPLLLALSNGYENIATELILHGADLNCHDNKQRTPLMLACLQGMSDVAALLLSKGAHSDIHDPDGKSLEAMASEAGHGDIVEILRNRIDSGYADTDTTDSADTDVHDEDGIDTSIDQIVQNEARTKGNSLPAEKLKRRSSAGSHSLKRNSSTTKYDENSFTSSIIESLMGYDVSSDTISEMSATEDQLHMKIEDDHKALEKQICLKDLRIQELEAELASAKNKLKLETEMRFAAEKEVLELKLQRDVLMENIENVSHDGSTTRDGKVSRSVTFGSDEYLPIDDTQEDESEEEEKEISNEETEVEVNGDATVELRKDVEIEEGSDHSAEEQLDAEEYDEEEEEDENASDSDDSVSHSTGYRKKSLGTAKQHIDMLEEHILSLEEDIMNKDNEINDLEVKLQSSKELVDLNNNTTVSMELFNEFKNEKILERSTFKSEIRTLERKVERAEETARTASAEKEAMELQLQTEGKQSNQMKKDCEELKEKLNDLEKQLNECNESYEKTIQSYRANITALYQNELDTKLKEVLLRIVKLRSL